MDRQIDVLEGVDTAVPFLKVAAFDNGDRRFCVSTLILRDILPIQALAMTANIVSTPIGNLNQLASTRTTADGKALSEA